MNAGDNNSTWNDQSGAWIGIMERSPHTAFGITAGPTGTPNPVASGMTVQCSVTVPDTLGHTVSYGWTVTGGTFSNPNLRPQYGQRQ